MNEQVQLIRKRLEAKIDDLIELLDLLDGDPDLEDGADDEPSLGSTPYRCEYDLELDTSDDELTGDDEPKHGWSNPMGLRVEIREDREQLEEQGWIQ